MKDLYGTCRGVAMSESRGFELLLESRDGRFTLLMFHDMEFDMGFRVVNHFPDETPGVGSIEDAAAILGALITTTDPYAQGVIQPNQFFLIKRANQSLHPIGLKLARKRSR